MDMFQEENVDGVDEDFVIADPEESIFPNSIHSPIFTLDRLPSPNSFLVHHTLHESDKFPYPIKPKQAMNIGDVVKDHVLPFLPAKSLCRFRTVSREWDQWIGSPFLAHLQTTQFKDISGLLCQFPGEEPSFISLDNHAYHIPCPSLNFLPEPVLIRATCHGLLACQCPTGDRNYYVCNPATKAWRLLPKPFLDHGPESAVALAFDPSALGFSENYELICAVRVLDFLRFEIYSSRSSSWRVCYTVCVELDAPVLNGDGFYMKGFVYWETQSGAVLAFDVKNEDYGILSLPPGNNSYGALSWAGDELCYLLPREQGGTFIIEVYGGMDMSLKRVIHLNPGVVGDMLNHCRVLAFVSDDKLILILGHSVVAYNARARTLKWLAPARDDGFVKFLPYVNSLVNVGHPLIPHWET